MLGQRILAVKEFFDPSIVDAQKLIASSNHVFVIRLSFRSFLIEKLVHSIFHGRVLHQARHNSYICRMWYDGGDIERS